MSSLATTLSHSGALPKRLNASHPVLPSLDEIKFTVCKLFTDSQHNSSSHRQHVHSLRKLLSQASSDASMEEQFFVSFVHCVMVILGLKKTDEVGTRMVRFVAGFVVYLAEHGDEAATRFIENLILFCLEHVDAKDNVVRMRLAQLLVACLNAVDELSDDVWSVFRVKMTERLFDKEASVRVHAIHAMSRLQGLTLAEEGGLEVIDIFLDLLAHDPSAEVRRVALSQVDVTSKSLPFILERRHDLDNGIRRMFYAEKMKEIDLRMLTIQQRDDILHAGLSDREEPVRQACAEMIFTSWIQRTNSNLIEFLACLDVVTDTEVGEKALNNFFALMPDMFHSFPEQYFANITVEMAFVLRVFCQHKRATKKSVEAVQDMLPELTLLAKSIQRFYECLITVQDESAKTDLEFIIKELLVVTEMCDFSDEVGRRAVIEVVDDILTNLELGEPVLQAALKLLNTVCSPQEFLLKVTELVSSFRDVYEQQHVNADTLHQSLESLDINSTVPEHLRILAHLKALDIIRHAMCLSDSGLQPEMVTLLDHVVIPSINSTFAAIQSSGLRCLGLYGTVSKDLAGEYTPLLIDFYLLAQGEVRNVALQLLFDWLVLFGVPQDTTSNRKSPLSTATRALYDPSVEIQCTAAEGFVRLLLHRIHRDSQVLEGLFHLYFHPSTADAPRLRQCLSYFFPVFAFTALDNQQMIQQVTPRVLYAWIKTSKQVNDAIPLSSVANQLFHLCDPLNLIKRNEEEEEEKHVTNPFASIGIELAWLALGDPHETPLCPIIAKLCIDTSCPLEDLKTLLYLSTCLLKFNPNVALKKSVATLVECTGGEGLSQGEMSALQERVKKVLPLGLTLSQSSSSSAQQKTSKRRTVKRSAGGAVTNILDEIEDFNSSEGEEDSE